MSDVGRWFRTLDGWLGSFSIEVFASILQPAWIQEALEATGRQTQRVRKLTAPLTVWLVVAMALFRNLSIQNILARLGSIPGVGSLWERREVPCSASSVEARDRVGLGPLRYLVEKFRGWVLETYREDMSWMGHLLLALDGSTFKVPDSPQNRHRFGLPGSNRGGRAAFPQMRAVFLVSTKLRFILSAVFAPYGRAEITLALRMLSSFPERSLVLMDRHFECLALWCGMIEAGNHFLVRSRMGKTARRVRVLEDLGSGDRLVDLKIPRSLRRRSPDLSKILMLREIHVRIKGKPYRFLTSLLDQRTYPAKDLVALYAQRWEEELSFDEIKTHQCAATTVNRPVIFRCMTTRRVMQEALGLVLAYNLVRALMVQAAQKANVPPLRISFVDSLVRIRDAVLLMAAAPTPALPTIYHDLIESLAGCLLPERRDRSNPREVCIKMSKFKKKWKRV